MLQAARTGLLAYGPSTTTFSELVRKLVTTCVMNTYKEITCKEHYSVTFYASLYWLRSLI